MSVSQHSRTISPEFLELVSKVNASQGDEGTCDMEEGAVNSEAVLLEHEQAAEAMQPQPVEDSLDLPVELVAA